MDPLTAEETEAFCNDIALPPLPLVGSYDTSAPRAASPSYPSHIDLLLQNAVGEQRRTVKDSKQEQHGQTAGSRNSSRHSTSTEKQDSTPPDRGGHHSPLYTSLSDSNSRTQTCSTNTSFTGTATATMTSLADESTVIPPLQQKQPLQQQQQQNLSPPFTADLCLRSSSGAPTLQAASVTVAAAADIITPRDETVCERSTDINLHTSGGSFPRDSGDLSGTTVNLYEPKHNVGRHPGSSVPAPAQLPGNAPLNNVSNPSSRAGVFGGASRPARSYGTSVDLAASARETLPYAASQVQAWYLAVRHNVLGRTASWTEFCRYSSFERPATGAVAVDRVERNVRFFFMNYALLCAALLLLAIVLKPAVLLVGGIFGGAAAAAGLHGGNSIRIGDSAVVPIKNIRYFCGAAGFLTLLFIAGQLIIGLLAGSTVLILLHSALHVGVPYEKIAQHCADEFDCAV